MDEAIFAQLARQPPLGPRGAARSTLACKVCGGAAPAFDVVDFNKCCSAINCYEFGLSGVMVPYHRCLLCGFMFTAFFDNWSAAEFSRFVYNDDYVTVDGEYAAVRPAQQASTAAALMRSCRDARILDYGSGTGAFAGRLLELGFARVSNYDPFSSPARPEGKFDIITCFEVIEHATSPESTLRDVRGLLAPGGVILFSTGIQPADIARIRANWWYVGPRNGHASIFTHEALALLGQRLGFTLHLGAPWLAYRSFEPASDAPPALDKIGRPFLVAILGAPRADGISHPPCQATAARAADWLGPEADAHGAFRWTRAERVEWTVDLPISCPATLTVLMPFRMEIAGGFAARCRIAAGDQVEPMKVEGSKLSAAIELDSGFDGHLTLLTPPPLSPAELHRATDRRRLGIALPA